MTATNQMADSLKGPPDGGKVRRPWEAIGMSRASWYRHGRPLAKPERSRTQKEIADILGVSVRTIQRDQAKERQKMAAEEKEGTARDVARCLALIAQGYNQEEAIKITISETRQAAAERD